MHNPVNLDQGAEIVRQRAPLKCPRQVQTMLGALDGNIAFRYYLARQLDM